MKLLLANGRLVDLVLVLVAFEALLLCRRPDAIPLLATLASGACLLLALRAALCGAPWTWIAACLLGAGLTHAADLWLRLR